MDGAAVEHEVFAIPLAVGAERLTPQNDSAVGQPERAEFIVGPENRLAGWTIQRLLERAECSYSPLVLCGPSGTGKTHLAQSIAQSRADAVYIHGADFARDLAAAVDGEATAVFRQRFRTVGLFVLDNLSSLVNRRATLEELQHTLDELESREATVMITCDRPPQEMADLPPALRSRLCGGLIVKLSTPGIAARRRIVERLATTRGMSLSPEAAKLLAERLNVTAPELRGHLAKLALGVRIDGNANHFEAQDVRRYLSHGNSQRRPNLQQITAAVAKHYGLKPAAMSSSSRRRQVVFARAIAIYLGRTLCNASLKTLGKHFGGRDHTTALHSFRKLQSRLESDAELTSTLEHLQQTLTKCAS
jgi:chromosomal replication initiator protein